MAKLPADLGKCGQTGGGLAVDWKNRVPPAERCTDGASAAPSAQRRPISRGRRVRKGAARLRARRRKARAAAGGREGGRTVVPASGRAGEEGQTPGTRVLVETLNCPNAIAK